MRLAALPRIFHFTDVANLGSIMADGCVKAHRRARCNVDIGDQSVKRRRGTVTVPCGPEGTVGDYVPFYFATRSPMLFSISCGNVTGVSAEQRRLAYVIADTEAAYEAELDCVFTDGNAAAAISDFEDDPDRLGEHVDWPLMKQRYWANTDEDPDRRRRRMAEFLIHEEAPLGIVRGIAVYDQAMRGEAVAIVAGILPVAVRPGWYF